MTQATTLARDEADLGDLPIWDLTGLYAAPDAPEIAADLAWLADACAAFARDYEGRLAALDAAALLGAIRRWEAIQTRSGRLGSYAGLRYYQKTTDPERAKAFGDMQTALTDATTPLVFFTLELNRIDDASLDATVASDPDLLRYKPVLDRIRKMKPHQLSDELERFLHDQSVVGAAAWNRLFDETLAGLRFDVLGESRPLEATLDLLSDPDRARRQAGAEALAAVFQAEPAALRPRHQHAGQGEGDRGPLAQAPDAAGRPPPRQRRRAGGRRGTAQRRRRRLPAALAPLLRPEGALARPRQARGLGPQRAAAEGRRPQDPLDQARATVLDAYAGFDPRMAALAEPFFDHGWIDAPVTPGKAPGAFAHPTVTDAHPFVLLNYLGKQRDVMTLAHELGHGVHQRLAAAQGELLSSTPLTLAETASVFGEMLTFQKLLDAAPSPAARKILLASKVEDMINTVVRQIAFYDFESKLHAARRQGELTPDDINALWMSVQAESLGPAFDFMPGYETFWAYIPHFIHSPFYVYAYAFGDGLVNALYAVYRDGDPRFADKYFAMLEAGGSKHHRELLAPFGLDASDPAFWDRGLGLISAMIDELEAMEEPSPQLS